MSTIKCYTPLQWRDSASVTQQPGISFVNFEQLNSGWDGVFLSTFESLLKFYEKKDNKKLSFCCKSNVDPKDT